jgi:diguanylate cyclase (GGDEF)-like protein
VPGGAEIVPTRHIRLLKPIWHLPMTRHMDANGSWLCPTERDRERLLDMSARVKRARTISAAALGTALVVSTPWVGPWPLLLLVLVGGNLAIIEGRLANARRPEYVAAASMFFLQAVIGAGIALTGGAESSMVAWIVVPTAVVAARFKRHVVFAFAASAVLVASIVVIAPDPRAFLDNPVPLIATIGLLASIVAVTMALMNAELQHREEAVIDPLTGLLNRKALDSRFRELEQQARQSEASVCVIAADLDNFKKVNDVHGHARGDDVLRDVTYEMRKRLRTFELMYRVGGEEFLTVLPGIDLPEGVAVAERLRQAVEECKPAGLEQTISMGVASAVGAEVGYESLLVAADRALYAAKDAGRNIVRADGHDDLAPMLEALGVVVA